MPPESLRSTSQATTLLLEDIPCIVSQGASRRRTVGIVGGLLAAALSLFGFDVLLFRTGIYASVAEPDSTSGYFELTLRRELQKQSELGGNVVLTLGDSRFGYLPRLANELTPESGLVFRHAGVPGTNAQAWYYMLRDLDATARRYRAIVFGVNDYDDEDLGFVPESDLGPTQYFVDRLRIADIYDFASSFNSPALRWAAFRTATLKGFSKQQDLQALLCHPLKRLADVKLYREGFEYWTYTFEEDPHSMAGLKIDWATWQVTFPPGITDLQKETVREVLMHPVRPQLGVIAAFRRKWFGRILDRYRGSPTRIIFLRLGRGPVPRPDGLVRKLSSSIREFAARPNVSLAGEHAFEPLEHPEFYKDGSHLNRAGCERFSAMLVREVARILATGRTERP